MKAREHSLSAAVLSLALVACGCGGGGYDGGPSPGPSPGPGPAPGGNAIRIVGQSGSQAFDPNPAPAPASSQGVAWRNDDSVVHRIVANDGSFDTGNIAPGATSAVQRLATDGTNYHCSLHPGMIGSINSSSGAPPPCTGIYCDER